MNNTAFVFPGQGSQNIGMGKDIFDTYPIARHLFRKADEILGFSISDMCFEGPKEALDDTIHTQPALYVSSVAIYRALKEELPDFIPTFVAGHSLGEFTALHVANVLSFEDGLRLVYERGRLMKQAGEENPGAMAAILGLQAQAVEQVCTLASDKTGKSVVLANDNCSGQAVISGDSDALNVAMDLAKQSGAKRVIYLHVSVAAHSPLMGSASQQFGIALDNTPMNSPEIPIYGNVTADKLLDEDLSREELNLQLTHPVRWTDSVNRMIADGATRFVEIGSGEVLTGLLRRIDRSVRGVALTDAKSIKKFVEED
jgi:[acyl-carrier-protein] S-malonyltransferase